MPLSRIRRCFWVDIPPTIAAILTCGGAFVFTVGVEVEDGALALEFSTRLLLFFSGSFGTSTSSSLIVGSDFETWRHMFR